MTYMLETTGWISWTPVFTGLGTVSSVNARYRHSGKNTIELLVSVVTGTPSANPVTVTLPESLTVDTALASGVYYMCGRGDRDTSTTSQIGVVCRNGDQTIGLTYLAISNTNHLSIVNGDALFGSSERESFFATVPVARLA